MGIWQWATRQLQVGDLTALERVRKGMPVEAERLNRLRSRGFIDRSAVTQITLRGRIALAAKRLNPFR